MAELDIPTDVLNLILNEVDDLPILWTDCRRVSRNFAQLVEDIFIRKHLSKTWLRIDGGTWVYGKNRRVELRATFEFDRFDPADPSRAIFVDKGCAPEFHLMLINRIRSVMENGNPAHSPEVFIQVRRMVNDTAMPGLEFDFDKLEMRFEWRNMYSSFFKEEKEYERRQTAWNEGPEMLAYFKDFQEWVASRKQSKLGAPNQTVFSPFRVAPNPGIRKAVRRERIYRELLENEGVEWTWEEDDDKEALEKLDEERYAASVEDPYSDESDSDDSMDEDAEDNMDEDPEDDEMELDTDED